MIVIVQLGIGLLFGLGLVISGMSNPAKVLNFLDVAGISAGTWDPSLVFVMAGAIAVTLVGFKVVLKGLRPLFGDNFYLPTSSELDARIIVGPAIFGIGWGMVGLCPGPAFTALSNGGWAAIEFVAAMLVGMIAARWLANHQTRIQIGPVSS